MSNTDNLSDTETLANVADRLVLLQFQLDNLKRKLNTTSQNLKNYFEESAKSDVLGEEKNLQNTDLNSYLHHSLYHRKIVSEGQLPITTTVNTKQAKINDATKDYNWTTCELKNIPAWLQVNNYIKRGYRPQLSSFVKCSWSIFRIHTETVNIWTHLLGCLIFIALTVYLLIDNTTLEIKLTLLPFLMGAIVCLGLSTAFHTLQCHSESVFMLVSRMDYCGIICLTIGSFIPWLYYGFYCDRQVKFLYLTAVSILGIFATVVSFSKTFNEPTYYPLRASVFTAFGLSGVVPCIHYILINGWESFIEFAMPLFIMAVLYIGGAVIYASRIPERVFPGKCDIWFQSHQIFHILVLIATLINYNGLLRISSHLQLLRTDPHYCQQQQQHRFSFGFH